MRADGSMVTAPGVRCQRWVRPSRHVRRYLDHRLLGRRRRGRDNEPDHGLRDPAVREAWAARLRGWLPERAGDVLDLGCGTGSLALLAAERGHRVTGVDRSPRMVELARAKLGGTGATVLVGDAAEPPVGEGSFDVVLVRHLLWMLPDRQAVLRRWVRLLRPGGRLVLIEGRWGESDPVGLPAAELSALVGPVTERLSVEQLAPDAALWGRVVRDERYALVADLAPARRHTEIVDVHLILRRGDEVLLARRANTGYADGLLHAPSGHVEDGEDVRAAMLRETAEEIGLTLGPDEVRVVLVLQHKPPTGAARTGWFSEAEQAGRAGSSPSTGSRGSAPSSAGSRWTRCRTTWWRTAGPASRRTARATVSPSTGMSRTTRSRTPRRGPAG
ncbi:2-methoxy-6-polyprenyl-1,4-benzoquinol methylase, mitochondrial [Streptomyces antimycoticus]